MKGSYILVVKLRKNSSIKVGSLDKIFFPKGYYCYVGSALGKTVYLEKRLERYGRLNRQKKGNLHWHIDYLLVNPAAKIVAAKIFPNRDVECEVSRNLAKISRVVKNFGSSDCKCEGHLFYFENLDKIKKLLVIR